MWLNICPLGKIKTPKYQNNNVMFTRYIMVFEDIPVDIRAIIFLYSTLAEMNTDKTPNCVHAYFCKKTCYNYYPATLD